MMHALAFVVWILLGYLVVGAIFAVAFVLRGAGAIDEAADRAPLGVRLVLAPGAAVMWPVLLMRWVRSTGGAA